MATFSELNSDWSCQSCSLLASERLGSSSRKRRSCDSRKRRKLMPLSWEGKVKKRAGIRAVTCGSSQPNPSWYSVSSASSAHICSTSDTLVWGREEIKQAVAVTLGMKCKSLYRTAGLCCWKRSPFYITWSVHSKQAVFAAYIHYIYSLSNTIFTMNRQQCVSKY